MAGGRQSARCRSCQRRLRRSRCASRAHCCGAVREAPAATRAAPADVANSHIEVTLYFQAGGTTGPGLGTPPDHLVTDSVTVPSTGSVGLDALRALMSTRPDPAHAENGWTGLTIEPDPLAKVLDVSHSDGIVTVDLDRDVSDPYPIAACVCPTGRLVTQQLVWTAQDALDTRDPVLITVRGVPATEVWGYKLDGPVEADPSLLNAPSTP